MRALHRTTEKNSMNTPLYVRHPLWEILLIFGSLPLLFSQMGRHAWLPAIWVIAVLGWWRLQVDHKDSFYIEWNTRALTRENLAYVLKRFCVYAMMLVAFTWWHAPQRLFEFPLERPYFWALVMLLYPVLSVFPQEVIYRSFFLRRYRHWLNNPQHLALANAIAFGWAHIVLGHFITLIFCFIGGLIFADTYLRTRSLSLVCFEHSLYGCWVFTLGLGHYFY